MRPKLSDRLTATGEPIYTYLCTTKERSRGHVCDMKNVSGIMLDAKIIDTIKNRCKQSTDMAKQIAQIKTRIQGNREGYDAEIAKIKSQMEENEKNMKALVLSLVKSEGTNAEKYIMEQIDELHEKGERLKKRLSELEAITQQHDLAEIEFDLIRQLLSNMGANIEEYSIEQKRAAIRTFIRKIVWDGENAHVYLFHNDGDYDFPNPPNGENESGSNLSESEEPSGEDSE